MDYKKGWYKKGKKFRKFVLIDMEKEPPKIYYQAAMDPSHGTFRLDDLENDTWFVKAEYLGEETPDEIKEMYFKKLKKTAFESYEYMDNQGQIKTQIGWNLKKLLPALQKNKIEKDDFVDYLIEKSHE